MKVNLLGCDMPQSDTNEELLRTKKQIKTLLATGTRQELLHAISDNKVLITQLTSLDYDAMELVTVYDAMKVVKAAQASGDDLSADSQKTVNDGLAIATAYKLIDEVDFLLDSKLVDINAQNSKGHCPLYIAINQQDYAIGNLLLDFNPSLKFNADNNACTEMIYYGAHEDAASDFFTRILQMDPTLLRTVSSDNSNEYPLHLATSYLRSEYVQIMLDNGADVDAAVGSNHTALQTAASKGMDDVVGILISANADVNRMDHRGRTPLALLLEHKEEICAAVADSDAAAEQFLKTVKLLVNAGATITEDILTRLDALQDSLDIIDVIICADTAQRITRAEENGEDCAVSQAAIQNALEYVFEKGMYQTTYAVLLNALEDVNDVKVFFHNTVAAALAQNDELLMKVAFQAIFESDIQKDLYLDAFTQATKAGNIECLQVMMYTINSSAAECLDTMLTTMIEDCSGEVIHRIFDMLDSKLLADYLANTDNAYDSYLCQALVHQNAVAVKCLVKAGADLFIQSEGLQGFPVLALAKVHGNETLLYDAIKETYTPSVIHQLGEDGSKAYYQFMKQLNVAIHNIEYHGEEEHAVASAAEAVVLPVRLHNMSASASASSSGDATYDKYQNKRIKQSAQDEGAVQPLNDMQYAATIDSIDDAIGYFWNDDDASMLPEGLPPLHPDVMSDLLGDHNMDS